ncbi:MAG: 30S ribosomal protein S8 [Candidatus Niyogibacteria bacterium]|nr:30S ribosomal protein S8 [Candidatus Niyogibacteria bacterium]
MVTDPIADMFTRIKNAQRARKQLASFPFSKIKMEILKVLNEKGFVGEPSRKGKKNKKSIEIPLLYEASGESKITEIKRVSKPSRRVFKGYKDIRTIKGGRGFYIISSPQGVIDDAKARKSKTGGEILGEAW